MGLTVISFIVVMGVVVFVHELGHFLIARRNSIVVEEFGFGYPPRLVKVGEQGGTVFTINAIPFGGFARMRGEDDPTQTGSFAAAGKGARAAVLLAGPVMNFVLATLLFMVVAMLGGTPDRSRPGVVVRSVSPGSPAEQGGLQIGDRIIGADNQALISVQDLQEYTSDHLGQPVVFTLVRETPGAETVKLTITPRQNPPKGEAPLGIGIGPALRPTRIWEAAWSGLQSTGQVIGMTFMVPAMLIREGKPISDAGFMGPVGIAATTGDVVRSALAVESVQPVIWFMALLSAALGITNLLPIPALDGGRLLFVLLEWVRRKRIEPAQEGLVHLVGFGLLLLLVGVVTVREVTSLVNGTFPSVGIR